MGDEFYKFFTIFVVNSYQNLIEDIDTCMKIKVSHKILFLLILIYRIGDIKHILLKVF